MLLMRVTVIPTEVITDLDGVKVRLWTGATDSGIKVTLAVRATIVHKDEDCSQFERELVIQLPPLERHAEIEDLVERVQRGIGSG
jgi:hypothetical protein